MKIVVDVGSKMYFIKDNFGRRGETRESGDEREKRDRYEEKRVFGGPDSGNMGIVCLGFEDGSHVCELCRRGLWDVGVV